MIRAITNEELRAVGFTPEARHHPRDELSLVMLCAFNNIKPEQAPPAWWFFPHHDSAQAWDRVAKAARAYIEKENLSHGLG